MTQAPTGRTPEDKRPPAHAITIWLANDQLMVAYPDGQLIPIPADGARILSILRSQEARTQPVKKMLLYPTRPAPAPAPNGRTTERKAERLEREKRARMKRIEKRDRARADQELLDMLGL